MYIYIYSTHKKKTKLYILTLLPYKFSDIMAMAVRVCMYTLSRPQYIGVTFNTLNVGIPIESNTRVLNCSLYAYIIIYILHIIIYMVSNNVHAAIQIGPIPLIDILCYITYNVVLTSRTMIKHNNKHI